MSTDFNREVNDILFKLSDINLEEEVSFNLAIGEKLIGGAILNRVVNGTVHILHSQQSI